MWTYHRILRIPYEEPVSYPKVLQIMGKNKQKLFLAKRLYLEYLRLIIRKPAKYDHLQLVIQDKIYGKKNQVEDEHLG